MRVLFLANRHPVTETELRSLSLSCETESYIFRPNLPSPASVVITIMRNLNRSIIPLLKLRPPPVPVRWFVYDLYNFSLILEAGLLRREYDIIYAHWLYPAGLVALLSSKVSSSKVVSVVWGYDIQIIPEDPKYGIRRNTAILSRFVLRKSDAIIVNHRTHQRIASKLGSLPEERLYLLPKGVEDMRAGLQSISPSRQVSELLSAAKGKKVILLVASSLTERYGVVEFLQALPIVARACEGCLFVIVGDGPLKQQAMNTIEQSGMSKLVFFAGRIAYEQMPLLYNAATVVCDLAYPGQGTVSWEAASIGRPVIGILSPKSFVVNGETGFLIRKGDYLGLVESLRRILGDTALSARLGANVRTFFLKTSSMENRKVALFEVFEKVALKEGRMAKDC